MYSLDEILKMAQIGFYLVAIIITVLTYRSAKRGLLNTVNTEYQKRVMDRLQVLSDELASEFDSDSPNYWGKAVSVKDLVSEVNETFVKNKKRILERGEFKGALKNTPEIKRLSSLIRKVKTDPFIPRKIRDLVSDLLENRFNVVLDVYMSQLDEYRQTLAQGKHISPEELEDNWGWVNNQIVDELYERGCGVSQIEDEVSKIRLAIQGHLESFNPLRK